MELTSLQNSLRWKESNRISFKDDREHNSTIKNSNLLKSHFLCQALLWTKFKWSITKWPKERNLGKRTFLAFQRKTFERKSFFLKTQKERKVWSRTDFVQRLESQIDRLIKIMAEREREKKELNDPIIVDVLGSCCFGVKGMGSFHCERVQ